MDPSKKNARFEVRPKPIICNEELKVMGRDIAEKVVEDIPVNPKLLNSITIYQALLQSGKQNQVENDVMLYDLEYGINYDYIKSMPLVIGIYAEKANAEARVGYGSDKYKV